MFINVKWQDRIDQVIGEMSMLLKLFKDYVDHIVYLISHSDKAENPEEAQRILFREMS